jgi:hypothetical protein
VVPEICSANTLRRVEDSSERLSYSCLIFFSCDILPYGLYLVSSCLVCFLMLGARPMEGLMTVTNLSMVQNLSLHLQCVEMSGSDPGRYIQRFASDG